MFMRLVQWWSSLIDKLGGKVVASLIAAMMLTLVAVAFTDSWIVKAAQADSQLKVLNDSARLVADLKASFYRAESAQRGFLATERQEYLDPFQQALVNARSVVKQLDRNFDKDIVAGMVKREADLLLQISSSLEAKATEMKMTIKLFESGHHSDARQIMNLDQGLHESVKFTAQANQLMELQQQAIHSVRALRNDSIVMSRISLIGTAIALSLLVMLVIRQLLYEIDSRDRLSRTLADERVALQQELAQRTGLLETLAVDYQYDVERERRQLARELHDELGSILTATKMDISWVIRKLKEESPEASQKLSKTIRYLDQGIQFKRRIVQDLHPSMLSTFGFWPAMRSLVESAAERNEWDLDLTLPEESTQLSEALGLIAYRIVQETLNNATKYAGASRVSVSILVDFTYLKLEIEDNGIGMDTSAVGAETHGLTGMRHRVQAIGGQLDIISQPGHGVLTRAMIPLEAKGRHSQPTV